MTTCLAVFRVWCSYAEVRAEQRRELGIQELNPEAAADKVRLLSARVFISSRVNMVIRNAKYTASQFIECGDEEITLCSLI